MPGVSFGRGTEEYGRAYLRKHLGEEGYLAIADTVMNPPDEPP